MALLKTKRCALAAITLLGSVACDAGKGTASKVEGLGAAGPATTCEIANKGDAGPELRSCLKTAAAYSTVLIEAGTYVLNDPVDIVNGLSLVANGGAVVFKPATHAAILEFSDVPNQVKLTGISEDFSAASGYINMASYFAPMHASPIVLVDAKTGPVTQVFSDHTATWVRMPLSFAMQPPNPRPTASEGFSYWTWGSDQFIYLQGEMRDPAQNTPSYIAGNVITAPGHPSKGLAYAYLNALVGPQYAIDSPTQVNYSFSPFQNGQAHCPSLKYDGASDPSQGVTADTAYKLEAWIASHSLQNLGGDLGWQDVVVFQIYSKFEDTTAPRATEQYYMSNQWGYVRYVDNILKLDLLYNKFVASGSLGNLYARSPTGAAYYNYPGPVNCLQ